jgi:hypothetical protein
MTTALFSALQSAVTGAANAATDIRDIRGPLLLGAHGSWLLGAALFGACVAVACGAVWSWKKRTKPPESPYALAKKRLEHARACMTSESSSASFASLLFETLRDYLGARCELDAAHLTADEFMVELGRREQARTIINPQDELERLLSTCEQTKFSGALLSRESMASLCASALAIIERVEAAPKVGSV